MLVSVAAETRPGERRVALTPEAVSLLVGQGHDVRVEAGAGLAALATDDDYGAAGADVRSGDVLEGELLHDPRTMLLFGDAKESLTKVVNSVKSL